jgi:hypothetical protein
VSNFPKLTNLRFRVQVDELELVSRGEPLLQISWRKFAKFLHFLQYAIVADQELFFVGRVPLAKLVNPKVC